MPVLWRLMFWTLGLVLSMAAFSEPGIAKTGARIEMPRLDLHFVQLRLYVFSEIQELSMSR